jgi:hypothetical protein
VSDRERDLHGRQRVAERRHVPIEAANRSAFMHHRLPVGIGLGGREPAVGEIRQRDGESHRRSRHSRAIDAVTGHARRLIDLRAVRE